MRFVVSEAITQTWKIRKAVVEDVRPCEDVVVVVVAEVTETIHATTQVTMSVIADGVGWRECPNFANVCPFCSRRFPTPDARERRRQIAAAATDVPRK